MTDSEKLDLLLEKVDHIDKRVDSIEQRIDSIEQRVDSIGKRVDSIEQQGNRIEITLENETNRNIQLIAEGHLNLDRKLDEALKELQPNTIYHLKVNHLDGEVKKIKTAMGIG